VQHTCPYAPACGAGWRVRQLFFAISLAAAPTTHPARTTMAYELVAAAFQQCTADDRFASEPEWACKHHPCTCTHTIPPLKSDELEYKCSVATWKHMSERCHHTRHTTAPPRSVSTTIYTGYAIASYGYLCPAWYLVPVVWILQYQWSIPLVVHVYHGTRVPLVWHSIIHACYGTRTSTVYSVLRCRYTCMQYPYMPA
jgi:hypothetical protein